MAKKGSSFNLFYVIGMALVVVGSFLPVIRIKLGILGNIDFTIVQAFKDLSEVNSWLAVIMFAAAVLGLVFTFVSVSNAGMLKTVCLIASIVAGLIFFYNGGFFERWFKITGLGFYLILAGWVVGLVGTFLKK